MNGAQLHQMRAALSALAEHDPDAISANEQPTLLLANGWRTGSTLLQRVLVTDPRILIWGEPMGRMALIPRLAEMLCAATDAWPKADAFSMAERRDQLATSWIANLYPPKADLQRALRVLLTSWLAEPARRLGHERWGLKEVRLGAAEAYLLRWLFPRARIVVLVRHPSDAYRSARNWRLYYRWPDAPIDCAVSFARHWNRLALSWLDLPADFGHVVIRYEDLTSGSFDFSGLARVLDLRIAPERALTARVGVKRIKRPLTPCEHRLITREAWRGMQAFGYLPDGTTAALESHGVARFVSAPAVAGEV